MPISPRKTLPVLPRPLALPLSMVPEQVHSSLIARALSIIFTNQIKDGELEFLGDRVVYIQVLDAGIAFRLSYQRHRLVAGDRDTRPDLSIRGTVYDFLTLISRREDADTLFFQRRLKMEGDTELGLYVKNFLDGVDIESVRFYASGDYMVQRSMLFFERLFGYSATRD